MTIIIGIMIVLFLVLIGWTWHNLEDIDKKTKIIIIIVGIGIVYLFTRIIYAISKTGIAYENEEAMKTIQNVFVFLFTVVNGYIILPYVLKKISQINEQELNKENLKNSIIIISVIMIILLIFESKYLANVQKGIISQNEKIK